MMAASAALPAFQSNHSPAGAASFADQVSGSAIYLDSVAKPLFCGESGYGNISSNSARATRRRETDAGSRSFSRRHQSFSEEIGHAAADTYLITRLTFKLLSYLGTDVVGVHLPSADRLSRGHFQNVCSRESGCYMLHCCRSEMDESEHISGTLKRLLSESASQANYCARKHKVPLLLVEALHHLHIFIFVLAIVHVTFVRSLCFSEGQGFDNGNIGKTLLRRITTINNRKPGGIIALLDEACMFPKSTHETFSNKLYQTFQKIKRFMKPKLSPTDFTIAH